MKCGERIIKTHRKQTSGIVCRQIPQSYNKRGFDFLMEKKINRPVCSYLIQLGELKTVLFSPRLFKNDFSEIQNLRQYKFSIYIQSITEMGPQRERGTHIRTSVCVKNKNIAFVFVCVWFFSSYKHTEISAIYKLFQLSLIHSLRLVACMNGMDENSRSLFIWCCPGSWMCFFICAHSVHANL